MFCFAAAIAIFNDSSVVGLGGTVTALENNTTVRMVSEQVDINYTTRKIQTNFIFKNEGPATKVLMGFPEEGDGDIQVPNSKTPSYFEKFESWVDGVKTKCELWIGERNSDEQFYKQWWTKTVEFKAGQTRRVANNYITQYGSNTYGIKWLSYVLGTGKPWAGKIGSAKVIADISGLKKGTFFVTQPKFTRRSGNNVIWEFKNFEPEDEHFEINIGAVEVEEAFYPKKDKYFEGIGWVSQR